MNIIHAWTIQVVAPDKPDGGMQRGSDCQHYDGDSSSTQCGFTLVEMLVALAVFTLIISGFLFREQSFEKSAEFSALSQEVALAVRQAQTYGSAGRLAESFSNTSESQYGISFSKPKNAATLFFDADTDGRVDNASGEVVENFSIPSGFKISKLCGHTTSSGNCANDPAFTQGSKLNIFYRRPNPQAGFAYKKSNGSWIKDSSPSDNKVDDIVTIRLKEIDTTATSSIVVGKSGFIYVR